MPTFLRRFLFPMLFLCFFACRKEKSSDDAPLSTLPPLVLKDDTADLLLTWLDEKGEFHTVATVKEVPVQYADTVRVVLTNKEEGAVTQLLYIADLRQQRPDGSYPVQSMPRAQWEAMAAKRRNLPASPVPAQLADKTPHGKEETPPSAQGTTVVIYGASWCKPCHQVADYLKQKGVPVLMKDIEEDPNAEAEMSRKLAQARLPKGSIPVVDVGGRILLGYDRHALDAALAASGKSNPPL
jgi:glutaredoxin